MIIKDILDLKQSMAFFALGEFVDRYDVYLKLEGLNLAGSIKFKTALQMIVGLEKRGEIVPRRNKIIESSSGNTAIALSMICKRLGYEFCCVVDPNITKRSLDLIKLYGGRIVRVDERDENGGFLHTRIRKIHEILAADPSYVWTNQYANTDNIQAHYLTTAPEIHEQFPKLDYLFIGTGTTGTLVGCCRYFKEHGLSARIVAVEPCGSVTFGQPSRSRLIPGLGTSRRPEIACDDHIDKIIYIPEVDTVHMAQHVLARYGLLIGASTATVLQGVLNFKEEYGFRESDTIVVVSPDMGDKYIDTIFNEEWVGRNFGEENGRDAGGEGDLQTSDDPLISGG